jgi:manganese/zinc/iron transport system ATP- binding protein
MQSSKPPIPDPRSPITDPQPPIPDPRLPISATKLTVHYDTKPVLQAIDCHVPAGRLAAIIGPNGAGKTTLLKAMMGLVPTASGEIRLFGEPVDRVRQRVAYVPQRESVDWTFPVTVMEVALMGRYGRIGLFRRPGKQDRAIALECLQRVGMEALADRQIGQLSGGQQQRVFIARALAQQADLYLMDEPFAGVDAATEDRLLTLLQELKDEGKTVLLVHHDLQTVQARFDWVIMINVRTIAAGPTAEVFTPENLAKTYAGALNLLSTGAAQPLVLPTQASDAHG